MDTDLKSPDWQIVDRGIKLCGALQRTDKVSDLYGFFESGNGFIRRNALAAIREMNVDYGMVVSPVRRGLDDPYFEVRVVPRPWPVSISTRRPVMRMCCCGCALSRPGGSRCPRWRCGHPGAAAVLPAGRLFHHGGPVPVRPQRACARRSSAAFSGRWRRAASAARTWTASASSPGDPHNDVQLQARIQHSGKLSGAVRQIVLSRRRRPAGAGKAVHFYHAFVERIRHILRIFQDCSEYLTFRTMLAAITALLFVMIFGHPVIVALYRRRFRDTGGDYALSGRQLQARHAHRRRIAHHSGRHAGPAAVGRLEQLLPARCRGRLPLLRPVGYLDDLQKVRFKSSLFGLGQMAKTFMQLLFIVPFALFFISSWNPVPRHGARRCSCRSSRTPCSNPPRSCLPHSSCLRTFPS